RRSAGASRKRGGRGRRAGAGWGPNSSQMPLERFNRLGGREGSDLDLVGDLLPGREPAQAAFGLEPPPRRLPVGARRARAAVAAGGQTLPLREARQLRGAVREEGAEAECAVDDRDADAAVGTRRRIVEADLPWSIGSG